MIDKEQVRHRRKRQTCVTSVLICTAAISGFFCGRGTILCKAKEGDAEKEVTAFVTSYYEAQTPEGMGTLAEYVAEPESWDFQQFFIHLQTACGHGLTGYDNIDVDVYQMSDKEHWVAAVGEEWVVQNFDVTMPGMKIELVGRNRDGELQIETYNNADEFGDGFEKEVREICLSDEVYEKSIEISEKYNEVCAENPDFVGWAEEVSEESAIACGKALEELDKLKDTKDAGGKNPAAEKGSYVVKKGDCLWSIAEEQLGDGMRWGELYAANRAAIGENPDLLYVGIELRLP